MGANHSSQVIEVCSKSAGLPLVLSINENVDAKAAKSTYLALADEEGRKFVLKKPKTCRTSNDIIQQHWEDFRTTGDSQMLLEDLLPVSYISDLKDALKQSIEKSVVYKSSNFTGDTTSIVWLMSASDQKGRFGIATPVSAEKSIKHPSIPILQRLYTNMYDELVEGLEIADGILDYAKLVIETILSALQKK
jgi:hypothetical protein